MNANASLTSSGCSDGAASRSTRQFSAPGRWPAVDTKSEYASTVPVNASAMPTEQIKRYFQDASTEARVRSNGIAIADAIVVASMATHMSATLFAVTAITIVSANAFWKMRKRRVDDPSPWSTAPSPGPRADAVDHGDGSSTRRFRIFQNAFS